MRFKNIDIMNEKELRVFKYILEINPSVRYLNFNCYKEDLFFKAIMFFEIGKRKNLLDL